MPSPTSWSSAANVSLTGSQNIDALLGDTRWVSSNLTYSFPGVGAAWSTSTATGYGPSSSGTEPWNLSFTPLSVSQQTYFAAALQQWANVANLQFSLVDDTSTSVGDIRAAFGYLGSYYDAQAWSTTPGSSATAGDVWFNRIGSSFTNSWEPGGFSFFTALHELGHALGFKHPFYEPGSLGAVLPAALDSQSYTVMSYSPKPGDNTTKFSFYPTTPMLLDIQAIQSLYGADYSHNAGDGIYGYTDAATYHETIWDGGGSDTIRYSGYRDAAVDLRAGHGSQIGAPVYVQSTNYANLYATNNIWIAYGVTIENAIGGQGNDTLTGNDASNSLTGSAGNDTLDGGAGLDIALYSGNRAGFTVASSGAGFIVTDNAGVNGADTLANMERLQFPDVGIALDVENGNAGLTARILGAVFGLSSVSRESYSKQYVGIGLDRLDNGMSYQDLMLFALNSRLGAGFSDADEVNLLYRNVVGSPPSDADFAYWTWTLASGQYTQVSLAVMAAGHVLNAGNIDLAGLAKTGIEFV